jgi:hypothetical protein
MSNTPIPRTFAAVISGLRYGELGDELTEALRALTMACAETGKGGTLTLKLTLKPGKGGRHFSVHDDVALKLPKADRGESLMFPTPDGFLTRDDPKQLRLDGLVVVPDAGPVVDVRTATNP